MHVLQYVTLCPHVVHPAVSVELCAARQLYMIMLSAGDALDLVVI